MQQRRLLVVEDDPDTLDFYESLLTAAAYAVTRAPDGQTAIACTADTPIDGILLDYRLPDTHGLELCRMFRATLGPDLTILLLTAEYDPGLEAQAYAAGATAFLRKPFRPDVLLTMLAAYVPV